ncbi:MAG TPA: hydroxyphenylacetyl-CoA thioesterase PaaI [Thauera sp.]|nr:hydroxyphenylacetyl-CoA thioesterase PaaI [Thauera sp.]
MTDIQTIPTDPQALAEAVAAAMWSRDRAAQALGIRIEAVGPGTATLSMLVRGDMVNGHHICHGGLIFSLADTAFAYACNAYNEVTVAAGFDVNLMLGARLGDVLTASATELAKTGRTGVYDIEVVNQRGERIALFRGRSYTMKGKPVVAL